MNIFSGMYILGRELRLIAFNTWAGWSAVSLGAVWLAGAAVQKAMDQSARVRQQARRAGETTATSLAAKRASGAAGAQPEREP